MKSGQITVFGTFLAYKHKFNFFSSFVSFYCKRFTYSSRGSGWEFYRVEKVFIEVIQFMPPTGAGHIPLSADLSAKKGVVNPQNKGNECFR